MRAPVVGAVVVLSACASSSAPRALKPSVEETVGALPGVVFQAALKAVSDQGLPLRSAVPSELVIQTHYVDMATFDPLGASLYPSAERLVRFRVNVAPNPNGPGSVVAVFGIYAPFRTGISTSERNERAIPRDHPAMAVVRRIRDDIVKAVGRG